MPEYIKKILEFEGFDNFEEMKAICTLKLFNFDKFIQRLLIVVKNPEYVRQSLENPRDYFGDGDFGNFRFTAADENKIQIICNTSKQWKLLNRKKGTSPGNNIPLSVEQVRQERSAIVKCFRKSKLILDDTQVKLSDIESINILNNGTIASVKCPSCDIKVKIHKCITKNRLNQRWCNSTFLRHAKGFEIKEI